MALSADVPLGAVAAQLNRMMVSNTRSSVFITAILGRVDAASGVVEYVNAGHPAPVLLRRGRAQPEDDGHALPLGVEADEVYRVQRIEPGGDLDVALFYTDGLIEAADPAGKLLNLGPVEKTLATVPRHTTDAVLRALLALVHGHLGTAKNADDLTLMVLAYTPAPGTA